MLGAPAMVFPCSAMVEFWVMWGLLPGRGVTEVEESVLLSHAHEHAVVFGSAE